MAENHTLACRCCGKVHPRELTCTGDKDLLIGALVDKYRIVRLIGRGGMGSVYEAQHQALQRRFAVKFMLQQYAANRDILRRFENEAKAAGRLKHANIAAVTDFGQGPDRAPYLVMEYLTGRDCAGLLATEGPLPVARAANIVFQACLGLSVAHAAGIVHRDIKPENLFVTDAGDGSDLVKILDFGIAKLRLPNASAVTGSGVTMGTCHYMAPEQLRDSGKVDQRADVWALGVVLYELVTGRKPFQGADMTKIMYQIAFETPAPVVGLRPDAPAALANVIELALKKNADERVATVADLACLLAPIAGRTTLPPRVDASAVETRPSVATDLPHYTTSHVSVATNTPPLAQVPPRLSRFKGWLVAGALLIVGGLTWVLLLRHNQSAGRANASDLDAVQSAPLDPLGASPGSAAPVLRDAARQTDASTATPVDTAARLPTRPALANTDRLDQHRKAATEKTDPAAIASVQTEPSAKLPQPAVPASEQQKRSARNPITIDTSSPF
jgi:serine/threonine-protein kinase